MKTKAILTFLSLILLMFSVNAQVAVSEYFFTAGALSDSKDPINDLVQTGVLLSSVADRDGFANNAVALNGDILQAVSGAKREDYSISFWMKTSTNGADQRIILDQFGGTGDIGYQIYLENGSLHVKGRFLYNNNMNRISSFANLSKATIADDNWHHVVLVINAYFRPTLNGNLPNTTYQLYVDNVLAQSQNIEIPTTQSGTDDFRTVNDLPISIGSSQDMNASKYQDAIDDIRLYNSQVLATQIEEIFNQRTSKTTIYVKSDALGNNDGSSWADAFTNLQDATDFATATGDEIWVAAGTYKPDVSDRTKFFTLDEGVKLYGGFIGTESQLSERDWLNNTTILSGDLADNDDEVITYSNALRNDNSYRIIYVEGNNTLLDGITITGGQANNTADNEFNRGGAIYKNTSASNFTIRNTTISKNVSNREGNIHVPFTGEGNELIIENCIVQNNFARYGGGFSATIADDGILNAKVYNSLFFANIAGNVTTGDGFTGSSLYFGANAGRIDLAIINSTFSDNQDLGSNASNDKGTIVVRRLNNDATSVANVTLHNNIFHNNLLSPTIVNDRVIGFMNRPSNKLNSLIATHNIANPSDFTTRATTHTVSDNINQDPLFTDAQSHDFTLQASSPAIDVGSSESLPGDLLGDLLGNKRIHNGEVDMGTYEAGSTPRNTVAPTIVLQNISVQLGSSGEVTVDTSQLNNGSSDDDTPTNELIFSLDKSIFTCEDLGDNSVTVTVEDASRNKTSAEAIVTVTSNILDETVSIAENSFCTDGSTTVSIASSVSGINYSLRNSASNEVIEGPILGTGNGLDFNTGTVSENTTFNVYGEVPPVNGISGGLDFDGTNDRIATTYTVSTTNTFTLEAWVFPRATSWNRLFSNMNYGSLGSTAGDFIVDTFGSPDNGRNVRFTLDGETSDIQLYADQVLTLNEWNHVAVTFDNGVAKILINGIEVASDNNSAVTRILGSSRPTHFGVHGGASPVRYFDGKMDEVRIWNVAKTATEISASMNKCLAGTENGLVAYFDFEDGSGTQLTDRVSGKNGTLINMDETTAWSAGPELLCGAGCGLQMSQEVSIAIGDASLPIAIAQDIEGQLEANGSVTISASDINNGSSDNCTLDNNLTLSIDQTDFDCTMLGANTVTLTVTDENGNQSTADATVTIVDKMAPTIVAQNVTVLLNATGNIVIDPSSLNAASFDNCSPTLTFALSQTDFDCSKLGANTVSFLVTDENGNTATDDVIITVEEGVPVAHAQDITVELDSNGAAAISTSDIDNGSSDDCTTVGDLIMSLDVVDFTCEDVGSPTQVTLTVADLNGNISTETAKVTVVDLVAPDVVTQNLTLTLDANGNATITAFDLDNGSTDNCTSVDDLVLNLDKTSFDINDLGPNTVTLSVADASGNVGSATATITVSDKETQTVTIEGAVDKIFGDEDFSISATADSNLPVTFAVISGGLSITETTANSATFMISGAGQAIIEVSNEGDATNAPLLETTTIEIAKADQVITVEEVTNKSVEAEPITISASVDTGLTLEYSVTGPATIANNVVTLTGALGTVEVTVSQVGTDNYNAISETVSFEVIEKLAQTITFNQPTDVIYGAADQTLTAASDSGLPVSFVIVSGTAVLSGNVLSFTSTGTIVVEANQEGDADYVAAAPVQQTIVVSKAPLNITADDQSITYGDALPTLTFFYDGFVNGEGETDLNATISISTTAGAEEGQANASTYPITITVTPSEAGDNYNFHVTDATLTIEKADQIITISPIDDKEPTDADFDVTASVDSELALIYGVSGPATIVGTTITLDGTEGTVTVTVSQEGDVNHNTSSATETFDVVVVLAIGDELGAVKIYPNPVVDRLTVESGEKVNIRFFSLDGKLAKSLIDVSGEVNVQNLETGTYLMEITTRNNRKFERIIKAN